MAYITEFRVTGLAGQSKPIERKLNRHMNVFYGLNGSGKTSLLRILHAALLEDASHLAKVPFESAEVVVQPAKRPAHTYTITKPHPTQSTQRALFEQEPAARGFLEKYYERKLRWSVTPPTEPEPQGWRHSFLSTSRLWSSRPNRLNEESIEDALDRMFEEALERQWLAYSGRLQDRIQQSQQRALADILNEVLIRSKPLDNERSMDWNTAYPRIASFLRRQGNKTVPSQEQLEAQFKSGGMPLAIVERINSVEAEIEQLSAPRTSLESLLDRMVSGGKKIRLSASSIEIQLSADVAIRPGSLSSGEKHLLRLLLEAISCGSDSFLIDEPEISLHVDWQHQLLGALREISPDAQIIAATHSPEIMAQIDDANIFRL